MGPKDLEKNQVVVARRDTGKKENIKISSLKKYVEKTLEEIQLGLLRKAEKLLKSNVVSVSSSKDLENALNSKKIALATLCNDRKCEDNLKFKTKGAKVLNIDGKKKPGVKCVICGKKGDYVARIGKSY